MATSGQYNFTINRAELIAAALRQTGRFGATDTISATDTTYCSQALNLLVKSLARNQKPIWCIQRVTVPMVTGQPTYNLSTITGQTRPIRPLFAFLRDSTGNDVTLSIVARDDYNTLGQKSQQGVPNQLFWDGQLGAVTVTVYNVPFDSTHTMYIDIQRQLQDMRTDADTPDFPQEAFLMLKWMLADEIALEYQTPESTRATISQKAAQAYEAYFADERAEVSTYFTPSERMR